MLDGAFLEQGVLQKQDGQAVELAHEDYHQVAPQGHDAEIHHNGGGEEFKHHKEQQRRDGLPRSHMEPAIRRHAPHHKDIHQRTEGAGKKDHAQPGQGSLPVVDVHPGVPGIVELYKELLGHHHPGGTVQTAEHRLVAQEQHHGCHIHKHHQQLPPLQVGGGQAGGPVGIPQHQAHRQAQGQAQPVMGPVVQGPGVQPGAQPVHEHHRHGLHHQNGAAHQLLPPI